MIKIPTAVSIGILIGWLVGTYLAQTTVSELCTGLQDVHLVLTNTTLKCKTL